ncbi:family 43 glycosylhydrolase [Lactovum odontotermitis]
MKIKKLILGTTAIVLAAVLVGCSSGKDTKNSTATSSSITKSSKQALGTIIPFTSKDFLGESTFKSGSTYYTYSSDNMSGTPHVRLVSSPDNEKFSSPTSADILPALPGWATEADKITRPGIWKIADQYVLYGAFQSNQYLAVGTAVSSTPEGPYTPADQPLLQAAEGVVSNYFDASIYQEDGKVYILYATDQALGFNIWIQELSADGLSTVGEPTQLLDYTQIPKTDNSGPVQLVERPALVKAADGKYVMFFSSDGVDLDGSYIGYATAASVMGPYTFEGPFVTTDQMKDGLKGPSEPTIFQDGDANYLIFNAWQGEHNGWDGIGNTASWMRYRTPFVWKDGHTPSLNK